MSRRINEIMRSVNVTSDHVMFNPANFKHGKRDNFKMFHAIATLKSKHEMRKVNYVSEKDVRYYLGLVQRNCITTLPKDIITWNMKDDLRLWNRTKGGAIDYYG